MNMNLGNNPLSSKPKAGTESSTEPVEQPSFQPVLYTSHPIQNFKVGRFRFVKGLLTLDNEEDAEEFQAFINSKGFPESERHRIKLINLARAEEIAKEHADKLGGATKAFDSSVGERAKKAETGTGDLADSNPQD